MRVTSALAAALVTVVSMLSSSSSVQATVPCQVAFGKMRASNVKRVIAGKTFTFSGSIKNTGYTQLDDLYFQIELPNYLVPIKATGSKQALAGGPGIKLENQYIWFRKMQLPGRKSLKIKATIGVKRCQPSGSVAIIGIAYQLNSNGQVLCSNQFTPYRVNIVRSTWNKNAGYSSTMWDDDDCTTPTPAPTTTFVSIGDDQRCLEARLLGSRRLEAVTATQEQEDGRELAITTYTTNQCYQACGAYLQVTSLPYYFNVDSRGQCYCCETCLALYDPDFTVTTSCFLVCLFSIIKDRHIGKGFVLYSILVSPLHPAFFFASFVTVHTDLQSHILADKFP